MMGCTFNSHCEKTLRKTQCCPRSRLHTLPCWTQGRCWVFSSVFPYGCRQGFRGVVVFSLSYLSSSQFSQAVDPSHHPSCPSCSGTWGNPASAVGCSLSHAEPPADCQFHLGDFSFCYQARLSNLLCYVLIWTGLLREKMSREEILVTLFAILKARGSIK